MMEAIEIMDFTVLSGQRGKDEQNEMYAKGASTKTYPFSKHNAMPLSEGIDIAPWPIDWNDTERFVYLAGIIKAIAHRLNIDVRWGGDWDGDMRMVDENFRDYGHFEVLD
jgi:peptidoglycan L-alanyl-D-glutamate endopeptidase CwlK